MVRKTAKKMVEEVEEESPDQSEEEEIDESEEEEDSEEEEEEEEDVTAVFKGVEMGDDESEDEDGSDESGDEDEDESGDEEERKPVLNAPAIMKGGEQYTFDLRNLLAVNSHQIATKSLLSSKKSPNADENLTISLDMGHDLDVNEEFLLVKASEGCTELIQALWQLPTERSDAGPMVNLPSYDEIKLPRALPPPPPKQETKWEKFARERGLPLNKEKRSRKVWDETAGEWKYRHGYEKANKNDKEWPIMEVKASEDPFDDPWERARDAKRTRTDKNVENRMRNEERTGGLAKGTTNRVLKSRERSRTEGKIGGNMDRDNVLPTGVPVDLKAAQKRGKDSTLAALAATQRSTASLGQFDQMRQGEPERRKALAKLKKRKFELATDKKVIATEGEKSMKILNTVVNGGGVAKEKAKRKGMLAKGETAYDYDYDDGLGPSTFKKKKGRAGAGKMKKMTKKRVK